MKYFILTLLIWSVVVFIFQKRDYIRLNDICQKVLDPTNKRSQVTASQWLFAEQRSR